MAVGTLTCPGCGNIPFPGTDTKECPACATVLPDAAVFCDKCGAKQVIRKE